MGENSRLFACEKNHEFRNERLGTGNERRGTGKREIINSRLFLPLPLFVRIYLGEISFYQ